MIGRRRSRSLFGWCVLVLTPGCASGPIRQLHPLGGDTFTLFPEEQRVPPPIRCSGETDARFECFRQELVERARGIGVAGALALATPDGQMRALGQPDSLNAQVTADTRFPAASVTKMFLAAAAVSLSREGALDLQQPIQRYLPELEQGVGHATLHQLLTHTSGLGNPPLCERASDDLRDLQQKYGAAPLWAPPGAVFNYSNLGYSFVALVLERVTGTPFEQVVQQRVLGPAGIPGASFGPDQVAVRGQHPEQVTLMPRCRAMWPAGGLTLSARELARWAAELAQPAASPLGPVLEQLMAVRLPQPATRSDASYGYGVQRIEQNGLAVFSHAGKLEDFGSFVGWVPERRLGVAVLVNSTAGFAVGAGLRALSTFASLSENWQPPRVTAHPRPAYAGTYVDKVAGLRTLRVSLEGDQLVIDYMDGAPAALPAEFAFVFEPGVEQARYVVTAVGVGERNGALLPQRVTPGVSSTSNP